MCLVWGANCVLYPRRLHSPSSLPWKPQVWHYWGSFRQGNLCEAQTAATGQECLRQWKWRLSISTEDSAAWTLYRHAEPHYQPQFLTCNRLTVHSRGALYNRIDTDSGYRVATYVACPNAWRKLSVATSTRPLHAKRWEEECSVLGDGAT
jgi:hypothetical protein